MFRSFSSTTTSSSSIGGTFSSRRNMFGCFGIWLIWYPTVSAFGKPPDGFLINPITGDSGADRLVPSELLCTQLRKSWICSFSCAGRYWILAKQNSKSESWGKQDYKVSDSYWPASRRGIFLCNKAPGVAFCFLLSSETSSTEVGGIQYHDL